MNLTGALLLLLVAAVIFFAWWVWFERKTRDEAEPLVNGVYAFRFSNGYECYVRVTDNVLTLDCCDLDRVKGCRAVSWVRVDAWQPRAAESARTTAVERG